MAISAVSVIIPSYNHSRYIGESIESVLKQSFQDFELIVVDDGSNDGSLDIIQRYAIADSRVTVVKQANSGSHAAINRGISMARGVFVSILNSDDRYALSRLERLYNLCSESDIDFAVTDVQLINEASCIVHDHKHEWNRMVESYRRCVRNKGAIEGLFYGNYTVSTSNFFFRKTLFTEIGPFNPFRYVLDWDYALRAALKNSAKFSYLIDEPLLDYRLHSKNTILSGMPTAAIEASHMFQSILIDYYKVPPLILASLNHKYRLMRKYQIAMTGRRKDVEWEKLFHGHLNVEHEKYELILNSRSFKLGRMISAPFRWLCQLKRQ